MNNSKNEEQPNETHFENIFEQFTNNQTHSSPENYCDDKNEHQDLFKPN